MPAEVFQASAVGGCPLETITSPSLSEGVYSNWTAVMYGFEGVVQTDISVGTDREVVPSLCSWLTTAEEKTTPETTRVVSWRSKPPAGASQSARFVLIGHAPGGARGRRPARRAWPRGAT